jgi:hypothetical protein
VQLVNNRVYCKKIGEKMGGGGEIVRENWLEHSMNAKKQIHCLKINCALIRSPINRVYFT